MGLTTEKYMLLTTYRKDGTPVATPVWVADMGNGEVGFWTSSESGKVKRLRHTPRVTVQACNAQGKPLSGAEPAESTARVISGAELEGVRQQIVKKYGFMSKVAKLMGIVVGTLRGKRLPYGDVGVAVVVPEALR